MIDPAQRGMRWRLALTVGVACSVLASAAFFYSGENHELEARAYRTAEDKAIFATAAQRGTTYAAVRASTGNCYSHPTIDQRECENRILYGDNFDGIWRTERLKNWLELPFDIAAAFFGGLLSVYAFFWCVYLIRDRWWPWVQGR
jgi:hypothetical protein